MSIKYTDTNPKLPTREEKNAMVPRKIFLKRNIDYVTRVNRGPQGSFNSTNKNNTIDLYDTIETAIDRGWISVAGADTNIANTNLTSTGDRVWSQGAFDASFGGDYTSFTMTNSGSGAINLSSTTAPNNSVLLSLVNGGYARLQLEVDANNIRRVSADDTYALELSGTEAGVAYTYGFPNVTPTFDGSDYVIVWNNGVPSFALKGGGSDGNGIISALPAGNVAINAANNQYDIGNIGRRFFEYTTAPYYTYELITETGYVFNGNSTSNNVLVGYGFDATEDPRFQVQLTNSDDSITIMQDMYADDADGGYWEVFRSLLPKDWALFMGAAYDDLSTNRFALYEGDSSSGLWANLYRYIDVTFGNTSANAISFYNDSYVFPNDTPPSDSRDYTIFWNNGTPTFKTPEEPDATTSSTRTFQRIATPLHTVSHSTRINQLLVENTGLASLGTFTLVSMPGDMAVDGSGMPLYWNVKGIVYDTTTLEQFNINDSAQSLVECRVIDSTGPKLQIENGRANAINYVVIFEYLAS